jgi:SAM-dependent methyltransferase
LLCRSFERKLLRIEGLAGMSSDPHFVRDYRRVVVNLLTLHPIDKAMALAVGGGDYDVNGALECDALLQAGLKSGHSVVDIGCGSGRLSTELSRRFGDGIEYLGIDVVPELIDYARQKASPRFRFVTTRGLTIAASDNSVDFVCAFSVFTHLKHRETLTYMEECRRVLRSSGCLLFTFLELPRHRREFVYTLAVTVLGRRKVQNHFISRRAIRRWAARLGFSVASIKIHPIGQTLAVLRKL